MDAGYVPNAIELLRAEPALRIAVVGRAGAGKTLLVSHFLEAAGVPRQTLQQPRQPPPVSTPPPIVARVFRSGAASFVRRAFLAIGNALAPIWRRSKCESIVIPLGQQQFVHVVEACGEEGIHAVARETEHNVDVVLFVTRLDDLRISKRDRIVMVQLARCFGEDVLDKTIFVLTHGHALPPFALSYEDYVRGRRDALWQSVIEIVPPVKDGERPLVLDIPPVTVMASPVTGEPDSPRENVVFEKEMNGTLGGGKRGGDDEPMPQPSFPEVALRDETYERGSVTVERDESEESEGGSSDEIRPAELTNIARDQAGSPVTEADIFHPNEDFDEYRKYKDPPCPEVVVVELSSACPVNDKGEKILADKTPWLPMLFKAVRATAASVRRRARSSSRRRDMSDQEERRLISPVGVGSAATRRTTRSGFWARISDVAKKAARDGIWVVAAEVAAVFLIMQIGMGVEAWKRRIQEQRRTKGSDLVLEMSDEEYESLTREDPQDKLDEFEGADLDEEDRQALSENSMDDAEEYFFGGSGGQRYMTEEGPTGPHGDEIDDEPGSEEQVVTSDDVDRDDGNKDDVSKDDVSKDDFDQDANGKEEPPMTESETQSEARAEDERAEVQGPDTLQQQQE